MKRVIFVCVNFMLVTVCGTLQAATFNWAGSVSSDWTDRNNWRVGNAIPANAPTATDLVFIGNSTNLITGTGGLVSVSFVSQPLVNAANIVSCASVTIGTARAVALTINGTLNISGDFTQAHSSAGANVSNAIAGSGIINCTNFLTGNTTAPPVPVLGLSSAVFVTTVTSTINQLNISNQLKLNTTSAFGTIILASAYNLNNCVFNLDGGSVSVGSAIATTNSTYVNSSATLQNSATVLVNSSVAATNLFLNGATPLLLDSDGAGGVDFYRSGAFTSTVIYNYTGVATQTVYTNSQTRLGVSPSIYQNIQFANAGNKTLQTGTITIAGNWTSAGGKVDAVTNDAIVTFDGSTQNLNDAGSDNPNGVVFKRVNFTGGGTKTMSAGSFNVAANGLLTMAGNSTLNANGNLTLRSSATSSANIETIPSGNSITGNVNVQRFLIGGNGKSGNVYTARGYRMLSSPVNINNTGLFSLNYIGNTALTGGPGSGFTVNNSNPTIYLYREDVAPSNTSFNSGKHKGVTSINADNTVVVSGTNGTVQIPVGNGFIFYFVGNTSNPTTKASASPTTGPENTIIAATGRLNQSDITTKLWFAPAGATVAPINSKLSYNTALGASAGYNMVGNPYAATLNLATVITDNPAIGNSIYVLDNVNPGQQYIAYSPSGSSSPKATQYVTSGQGFMVKAKAANATLTFRETQKSAGNQPLPLLMGIPLTEAPATGFYLKLEKDSLINDYCGVYFSGGSSAKFDDEDARDLDGASSQIYLSSYSNDGIRTAINHLPDYRPGIKNRLYVNAVSDGLYKLKIEGVRNIDALYDVWLKDNRAKDSLNISRYGTYNFRITRSDTTSFGANRFEIVIRPKPLPKYGLISFDAKKATGGIRIFWETANEGNFTGFEVERLKPNGEYVTIYNVQSDGKSNYKYTDTDLLKGVNTYRLKQHDIQNRVSWSDPKSVTFPDAAGNITNMNIYPNPAADVINVSLPQTIGAAASIAKIYGYNGTLVMQKIVQGNSWTQNIGQLMPGTYVIELSKPNGELIGRSKFIKR